MYAQDTRKVYDIFSPVSSIIAKNINVIQFDLCVHITLYYHVIL